MKERREAEAMRVRLEGEVARLQGVVAAAQERTRVVEQRALEMAAATEAELARRHQVEQELMAQVYLAHWNPELKLCYRKTVKIDIQILESH